MSPSPLNPQTLAENPQLAILAILEDVLEIARLAIVEAHADIWDEQSEASYHGNRRRVLRRHGPPDQRARRYPRRLLREPRARTARPLETRGRQQAQRQLLSPS